MYELYIYDDMGNLIFQSAHETKKDLFKWVDDKQAKGADTYWEWVEE